VRPQRRPRGRRPQRLRQRQPRPEGGPLGGVETGPGLCLRGPQGERREQRGDGGEDGGECRAACSGCGLGLLQATGAECSLARCIPVQCYPSTVNPSTVNPSTVYLGRAQSGSWCRQMRSQRCSAQGAAEPRTTLCTQGSTKQQQHRAPLGTDQGNRGRGQQGQRAAECLCLFNSVFGARPGKRGARGGETRAPSALRCDLVTGAAG